MAQSDRTHRPRNTGFGPTYSAATAPTSRPTIGPVAMIARAVPLRRAAPVGSAVASAWVAMFIAAKASPQSSRATSSSQTPGSTA